ncbi:probable LRR receptor-like serine/threonine-protein kinase At3g47570 [Eucalyptus grandis]|uniref:probable LRR receptor-like serine/threonine-protein kinase At3g47570 n=1 Tax=Eucalyptus grandis TaxID=71139 RepID=UPI00192E7685|nr:probable LRR receptor-like serine/threonine-protein kinase At3g47570 [Eucalyptus grandis]
MELAHFSFAQLQPCRFPLSLVLALYLVLISSSTNETDKLALLMFKATVKDPYRVLDSWNNTVGFCHWYGVICNLRHQRVAVLDLYSLGLSGSISPHIGNLSFLRKFYLSNNSLIGEIPPQVGRLRRLLLLQIDNNSLSEEIPRNVSGCSKLVTLTIAYNQLTGVIPTELGSLSKLQYLSFYENALSGNVPSSFGNLSSLQVLELTGNNLDGSIPNVLGSLANLLAIGVQGNRLSGTIPSSLLNLSYIFWFDVTDNQMQGSLPADIGLTLPNIQYFSIGRNQFEGPIPPSVSNWTNLEFFQSAMNKLSGKVPSFGNMPELWRFAIFDNQLGSGNSEDLSFVCSLTNSTGLEYFAIDKNRLGGALPKCIGNFSSTLWSFGVSENLMFGEIPREIGNLVNLNVLSMFLNQFSGEVPSNFGNLQNLVVLQLGSNKLRGTIPTSLGNLTKLIGLSLGSNNFHGQIPSHLSKCQSLQWLDLSINNLSSTIPPQLIGLSSITIYLDLSQNHLSGVLPTEVGNLRTLTELDIFNNMLVGEIPNSLGDCTGLTMLRMGGNFFHGSIPQSIKSLRGIEELDLSRNNLSGQIPDFLVLFRSLKLLNLSYNNFEGMLPHEGVFKNATMTSIIGNDALCGGLPAFHLPKCISMSSKRRKIHILVLSVCVIFGILGIALTLVFLYLCWLKKTVKEPISTSIEDSWPHISYQTLLESTDGFSSMNLIGVGSFGSIYKGTLEENGTTVAVKVLHLLHRDALKSFMAECETLKNIRHRNLLKIVTVCSGIDYQQNDFKALVYEYMERGSLERWLHPNPTPSHGNEPIQKLNSFQRINVAIGVASALDYLHHQCHIPIVHCDLKPSNVLLDVEMVAHVGDFGLAKFLLGSSSDTVANQMSSMGIRGTIGYAPPEYAMGCEVSREGDVYSYGILLLEMFTGLSPTDDIFRDDLTLHSFVAKALPGQVLKITDHILLQERENHLSPNNPRHWLSESNGVFQECLVTVYNIGVACSDEVPGRRMCISGAANQLQKIREKLFPRGLHGQK